jgi:hypothetical protein
MWSLNFDWINGMMLGIEFPTYIALTDEGPDEEAPSPFVIQVDLLIFRICLIKY